MDEAPPCRCVGYLPFSHAIMPPVAVAPGGNRRWSWLTNRHLITDAIDALHETLSSSALLSPQAPLNDQPDAASGAGDSDDLPRFVIEGNNSMSAR